MYKRVETRIGPLTRLGAGMNTSAYFRFGGLSDKVVPAQLSAIESPDLLNVDFSAGDITRRAGYSPVASGFKDASLYLDGYNDYGLIGHKAAYQPTGTQGMYIGIGVVLKAVPATNGTIVAKGYNGTHAFRLYYAPTTASWVFDVYNAAGVATSFTIADGTAALPNTNMFRYFEWYQYGTSAVPVFKMWDTSATVLTTVTGTTLPDFKTNSEPITLGLRLASASTFVGGENSPNCALFDFRYAVVAHGESPDNQTVSHDAVTTRNKRELTPTELLQFEGYWKLNDGTKDGTLTDSTTAANHGTLPQATSLVWNSTAAEICGVSGVEFHRGHQFINWTIPTAINTELSTTFAASTVAWHFSFVYVPKLPPDSTTVPDQCLVWCGVDATIPKPLGIQVVSDQLKLTYRHNAGNLTSTITSVSMTANVGKRMRIIAFRDTSRSADHLQFGVWVESTATTGTLYTGGTNTAASGATSTIQAVWSIGRHATSTTVGTNGQYSFHTDGATFGVIDSLMLLRRPSPAFVNFYSPYGLASGGSLAQAIFSESPDLTASNFVKVVHIKFDEGAGSFITVDNNVQAITTAAIVPEERDSGRWDIGQMIPYVPPICGGLVPYNHIRPDGTYVREMLVISGCSLYSVNLDTGVATPVGADLYKGSGTWSIARYADKVFLATDNGMRPMVYDGSTCRILGIEAPAAPPTVTTSSTGGTFAAGTYVVYYTYRNSVTAEESNPSPGTTIVLTGATSSITDLYLPTSPNRWVSQRRVYITLVNGATAYKAVDIDDNVTTNYTTDITAAPVSGTSLEFLANQEPPQASIVAIFKDFLFAAGESKYPTRVYRNTSAGNFSGWDKDISYVDLDLDSGDPVVNLIPLNDRLIADVRDGRFVIYLTGSSTEPFRAELVRKGQSSVGRSAATQYLSEVFYMGESDIYATDGYQDLPISSPAFSMSAPSIQYTVRTGLEPTKRNLFVATEYLPRSQVWFAVTLVGNSRNTHVLVYDKTFRNWTKYDIPADYIVSADNASDDSKLYGYIFGKLYLLDTGTTDGVTALVSGSVTSVSGSTITVSGTPFGAVDYRGVRVYVYRVATADTVAYTIYSNTSSTITVYESVTGVASGDVMVIGVIPFYIDFNLNFFDSLSTKRLRLLRLGGISSDSNNILRITVKPNVQTRTFTDQTNATNKFVTWTTGDPVQNVVLGGLGKTFRLRISEAGLLAVTPVFPVPSIYGTLSISDIAVEAEMLDIL